MPPASDRESSQLPWYQEGLEFACTQCGNCCRIEGYVWLEPEEIKEIAAYLEMDVKAFGKKYLRKVDGDISLIEKPNHDCIFWEDGCSIYPVRPNQCRTFPFWSEVLESREEWDKTATDYCPGMKKGGRHYSLTEIEELRAGRGETKKSQGQEKRQGKKRSAQ